MARKVLLSIEISSLKIQVVGVNLRTSIERDLEASTTTSDSCQTETETVEELVGQIACRWQTERRSLELRKDPRLCGKEAIAQETVAMHIDLGETTETVHDRETAAIRIDQAEVTETGHDQDHQDGTGIEMIETVGKGVPQGTWIVTRATSAEK